MTPDVAESLAVKALVFIASDEWRLQYLVNASGMEAADFRAESNNPVFLGGILDHLLADEALLLEFCEAEGFEPALPARARMALPGHNQDL